MLAGFAASWARTANALGVKISDNLLSIADELIE
jgi:hypothetical protein